MAVFDFITNDDLRAALESDARELDACLDAKAWKAAHVLAGSMIEAVLADYLLATDYKKRKGDDPLKLDLGKAIAACLGEGVLSVKTANLSSAVKDYRNVIHPGRALRLKERVDENTARVARALVGIIAGEVSERRSEGYGYTAEQLAAKAESDSSTPAILDHLLEETRETERRRLLLDVLPRRYLELSADEWDGAYVPDHVFPTLEVCFRRVLDRSPADLRAEVARRFVSTVKESAQREVVTYGRAFFRATDLAHLSPEDAAVVKSHLIDRASRDPDTGLLETLEGVGEFLTTDEAVVFVDAMVKALLYSPDESVKKAARGRLGFEYWLIETPAREALMKRLEEWERRLKARGRSEQAEELGSLMASIEDPF